MKSSDFIIKTLGKCNVPSPLKLSHSDDDGVYNYIKEDHRILFDDYVSSFEKYKNDNEEPISFEKAGPREKLFFDPSKTKAAIVSCGGLCPGINNVIRSLVMELHYRYGVKKIVGFKYGYEGLVPAFRHPLEELTPDRVDTIHLMGGSILGSSRGNQEVEIMVDALENLNINILFAIGGDGTLRGAQAIAQEIEKRNLKIAVAGIPKTIDNDINYIEKSFGFETAFSIANEIIRNAHNEAKGAFNGIALIKLMGRDSGFIAANAAISMQEVNFVLVPEMDFDIHGENGFLNLLRRRLIERKHAVIVVAEGAGQNLFNDNTCQKDASGNVLHKDIGLLLKDLIADYLKAEKVDFSTKYIDPSYIIRSAPAIPTDSMFCNLLAQNAVHGAMAGRTSFVTGLWNNKFTYLPIAVAIKERKKINLESALWWNVIEATGQPVTMKNK